MLSATEIDLIRTASHGDPFALLGPHADADGQLWLRAFLPGATHVVALDAASGTTIAPLLLVHVDGLFEAALVAAPGAYRLQVHWADGNQSLVDDPYRFPPVLGELDVWLMGEGTHLRPYEVLGATQRTMEGVSGTAFAVWAPNASRVSVVGDFNLWDGRRHPMRLRRECGVWEIFLPGVGAGARYKFEVRSRTGDLLPLKADPYALQSEIGRAHV
jgi:1,4-alpha-glucan branching enzyme